MQVREIMTNRVIVIDPNTTIRDAAHRIPDHHIGALPACESNRLIGIVTDRDIAVRAAADARSPGNTTVRQVMSESVVYCFEDDDAEQAAQTMAKRRIRRPSSAKLRQPSRRHRNLDRSRAVGAGGREASD
jgi:CBS domain-containing protein